MDAKRLAQIRERLDKAVPGPWRYDGMHYEIHAPHGDKWWLIVSEEVNLPDDEHKSDQFGHKFDPTYDFIGHSWQDITDLLAAYDAVLAAVGFELYYENDAWRPACVECGDDAEACCCSANKVRHALGITPPLDAEGNVTDEAEWERLLKIAQEES